MPKLNSVLRLLVLIFMSGWLGIATQPAAAQQTVTPVRAGHRRRRPSRLQGVTVSLEDPGVGRTGDGREWRLSPRGAAGDLPSAGAASARSAYFPQDRRAEALSEYHP